MAVRTHRPTKTATTSHQQPLQTIRNTFSCKSGASTRFSLLGPSRHLHSAPLSRGGCHAIDDFEVFTDDNSINGQRALLSSAFWRQTLHPRSRPIAIVCRARPRSKRFIRPFGLVANRTVHARSHSHNERTVSKPDISSARPLDGSKNSSRTVRACVPPCSADEAYSNTPYVHMYKLALCVCVCVCAWRDSRSSASRGHFEAASGARTVRGSNIIGTSRLRNIAVDTKCSQSSHSHTHQICTAAS